MFGYSSPTLNIDSVELQMNSFGSYFCSELDSCGLIYFFADITLDPTVSLLINHKELLSWSQMSQRDEHQHMYPLLNSGITSPIMLCVDCNILCTAVLLFCYFNLDTLLLLMECKKSVKFV